jgi:hypothetical protein
MSSQIANYPIHDVTERLVVEGRRRTPFPPSFTNSAHTSHVREEAQGQGGEEVTGTLPSPCRQDRIPYTTCTRGCCARQGLRCPAVRFRDLFDVRTFQQPQDSSFSRKSIHKKHEGKVGAPEHAVCLPCNEFDSACCSDFFNCWFDRFYSHLTVT